MPDESPGGLYGDEPSPEDVFSSHRPLVNVVLLAADPDKAANVVKGIRAVLSSLKGEKADLAEATALWERYDASGAPVILGYAQTPERAREAAQAGQEASQGTLVIGAGLTLTDLAQAAGRAAREAADSEPPPERMPVTDLLPTMADQPAPDWAPTFEASKAALVLMATADGSAQATIATARMLRHATGAEVWEDVVRLLLSAFPVGE